MNATDKRKQSVYFSAATLEEITSAATRMDRSLSWIVQKAWKLARREIMRLPGADGDRVVLNPGADDGP
jgi:uncharacterized small protein (TIGR04563 family)